MATYHILCVLVMATGHKTGCVRGRGGRKYQDSNTLLYAF